MQQILVVEDYADLTSAITASLADEYECTCVRTSEAAIARLQEQNYGAILLSPMIPVTDDPVMSFLHEFQPDELAKVIFMTFPDEEQPAAECRVLVKPFDREELFAELAKSE